MKKLLSLFVVMIMLFTLVALPHAYAATEIDNIYGNKSVILFDFSESVTVESVSVKDLSGNEVEVSSYCESGEKIDIILKNELTIDGKYIVGVKTADSFYQKYIWFEDLFYEDFQTSAGLDKVVNGNKNHSITSGGKLKIMSAPYYATMIKSTEENASWKDYTVEFEYSSAGTIALSNLSAFFYIAPDAHWNLNQQESFQYAGVAIGAYKHPWHAGDLTYGSSSTFDSMAAVYGEKPSAADDIAVYSASVFANSAYNSIKNHSGEITYIGKNEIAGINQTSGRFGLLVWSNPESAQPEIDNIRVYVLKSSDLEYTSNIANGEQNWASIKPITFTWNTELQSMPDEENIIITDSDGNEFTNFTVSNSGNVTTVNVPTDLSMGLKTEENYTITFTGLYDSDGTPLTLQVLNFRTASIYTSFKVDVKKSLGFSESAKIEAKGTTAVLGDTEVEVGMSLLNCESTDEGVIAIENGFLVAKGYGSTYITLTLENVDGTSFTEKFPAYVYVRKEILTKAEDGKIGDISSTDKTYVIEATIGRQTGYIGLSEDGFGVKAGETYFEAIVNGVSTPTEVSVSDGVKAVIVNDGTDVTLYLNGENVFKTTAEEYEGVYAKGTASDVAYMRTNDTVPTFTSVTISGDVNNKAEIGDTLTATTVYADADGDEENGSLFGWYIDGEKKADGKTIKVLSEYNGKSLVFKATPKNDVSEGAECTSASYPVVVGATEQAVIDSIEKSDAYGIKKLVENNSEMFNIDLSIIDGYDNTLFVYEEMTDTEFTTPQDVANAFNTAVTNVSEKTANFLNSVESSPKAMENDVPVSLSEITLTFPDGITDTTFKASNFSLKKASDGSSVPLTVEDGKIKVGATLDEDSKYVLTWSNLKDGEGELMLNGNLYFQTASASAYSTIKAEFATEMKIGEKVSLDVVGTIGSKTKLISPSALNITVGDSSIIEIADGRIVPKKRGTSLLTIEKDGKTIRKMIAVYAKISDTNTTDFAVEYITENIQKETLGYKMLTVGGVNLLIAPSSSNEVSYVIKNDNAEIYLNGNRMTGQATKADVLGRSFADVTVTGTRYVNLSGTKCYATLVSVTGSTTLTGSYRYNDDDNDAESGSTFEWFVLNSDGTYAPITGANSESFNASAYIGRYIVFRYTPKNIYEAGDYVESSPIPVSAGVVVGGGGYSSSGGGSSSSGGGGYSSSGGNIYIEQQGANSTVSSPEAVFNDVSDSHWAYPSIVNMKNKGVINGFEDGSFKPDASVTRGQFVCALIKFLNTPVATYQKTFTDVSENDWYASYIQTAYNSGYVMGDGATFRPNDTITRQEMAVIVSRVLNKEGTAEMKFTDTDKISEWAKQSISNVLALGVMTGNSDGSFAPLAETTRAQMAVILERISTK